MSCPCSRIQVSARVHKFYVISPCRRVGIISRLFAFIRRLLASILPLVDTPSRSRPRSPSISPPVLLISVPISICFRGPLHFPKSDLVSSSSSFAESPSSPHLILAPRSSCVSIRQLSLSIKPELLSIAPTSPSTSSLASSCTNVVSEPESISEHTSLYSFPSTSSEPSLPLLPSCQRPRARVHASKFANVTYLLVC
jgi:hypothetical protein